MSGVFHRNFFLSGPAGRLEALLWTSTRPIHPSLRWFAIRTRFSAGQCTTK
jgi:hypothetical protein